MCFTYNWDEHNPLPVGHPGSSYGLVLRLNIEQDQYTWSEFGGAGMKVIYTITNHYYLYLYKKINIKINLLFAERPKYEY